MCCALHGRARGPAENSSDRGDDSAIPPLWKNASASIGLSNRRDDEREAAELSGLSQPDERRRKCKMNIQKSGYSKLEQSSLIENIFALYEISKEHPRMSIEYPSCMK